MIHKLLCFFGIHFHGSEQIELAFNPGWRYDSVLGASMIWKVCRHCSLPDLKVNEDYEIDWHNPEVTDAEVKLKLDRYHKYFCKEHRIIETNR